MKIKLTKGFFIDSDEFQYILKQQYEAEGRDGTKREEVKTISYHRTLEQAIEKYLRMLENLLTPDKAVSVRAYVKTYILETRAAVEAIKSLLEEENHK